MDDIVRDTQAPYFQTLLLLSNALLKYARNSLWNWGSGESKAKGTWYNCWILCLWRMSMCSTSSILSLHWLLVCPMRPYFVQSLCTHSYLHWIQVQVPSSNRSMKPETTGIHGFNLTFICINLMFLGNLFS